MGAKGRIWIMDRSTHEIVGQIEKHGAEVYMCMDVGPLIWSVSWDKMIYTWTPVRSPSFTSFWLPDPKDFLLKDPSSHF